MDDLPIASNNPAEMELLVKSLEANFKFKDCGKLQYCLGLHIERNRKNKTIYLHQSTYSRNIVERFWKDGPCRPTDIPMSPGVHLDKTPDNEAEVDKPFRNLVGALMYLMTNTRPDLAFSVTSIARYMHKPGKQHWKAAKKILRYLAGTTDKGIALGGDLTLTGWADASFATSVEDCHSILGYITKLGQGPISWQSTKSKSVSFSSSEAEHYALGNITRDLMWIEILLSELKINVTPIPVYEDNENVTHVCIRPKTPLS